MTENEANIYSIAYRDCKEVSDGIDCNEDFGKANTILFYIDEILEALKTAGELQAIGTVEGYELAINESIDKHNLMVVYKDRLKEFEAIGTIEEFKALKEKEERFDRNIRMFNEIGLEIRAKAIDEFADRLSKYLNVESATKYGNKNAEQQRNSYDTLMKYEIADAIDDVAEQLKEGEKNE